MTQLQRKRQAAGLFAEFDRPGVPGAAAMVLRRGAVVFAEGFGLANIAEGAPCGIHTNFRLASVTKQFTAMAVLILASRKQLSLNEPLTDFFPEFPACGERITVRRLLQHTSGLLDYEELIPEGTSLPVLDRDVLRLLMRHNKTFFPPGAKYRYSNSAYALLALMVEARSGFTFAQFLRREIFEPLKMKNTLAYEAGLSTAPNRALGYSARNGRFALTDQSLTSSVLGDGGIYSNLADLRQWDRALREKALANPELLDLAFTPGPQTDLADTRYGLGWYIGSYQGRKEVWHSGDSIGFRTRLSRFPEGESAVIILANRTEAQLADLSYRLADLFLFA